MLRALFAAIVFVLSSMLIPTLHAQTTTEVITAPAVVTTTTERKIITTDVPAPKIIVETPVNYVNCFRVESGWHGDIWIPAHKICQYSNSPQGVAWVEGYWKCSQYKADIGECTSWDWVDAHWVKVLDVY